MFKINKKNRTKYLDVFLVSLLLSLSRNLTTVNIKEPNRRNFFHINQSLIKNSCTENMFTSEAHSEVRQTSMIFFIRIANKFSVVNYFCKKAAL